MCVNRRMRRGGGHAQGGQYCTGAYRVARVAPHVGRAMCTGHCGTACRNSSASEKQAGEQVGADPVLAAAGAHCPGGGALARASDTIRKKERAMERE